MRIIHLASSFLPRMGGAETTVHNLAMEQLRNGHEPVVVTWWGLYSKVHRYLPYPVCPLMPRSFTKKTEMRWRQGHGHRWFIATQIALYQHLLRAPVWHIHMVYPLGIFAVDILKRMGAVVIITCQGDDLIKNERFGFDVRLNSHLDRAICSALCASDGVTAISSLMRREFEDIGINAERIHDVPNAVNIERIEALDVNREAFRGRYAIPEEDVVLISVGRNHPQKGFQYIPQMIEMIQKEIPNFTWVIVGEGNESIAMGCSHIGVERHVRLIPALGPQFGTCPENRFVHPSSEMIEAYKSSDIFVMTSLWESFGIVTVEAMAAGLPIVAGDTDGTRDILDNGNYGLMCKAGDWRMMAEHIIDLINQPQRRDSLAKKSIQRAGNYNWQKMMLRYQSIYEKNLSSKAGV
ncbi:MAG: glycosyltransferase family 1 protein [Verrucomicrobiae bacterium]|nr:glycosyltransferase family 1 protein [Verrucomicrobiae bacterium]